MSSPPGSPPYMCSSSIQPSPQEPAYTAATYKPPSLYPHKKQRIDYQLEPVGPITAPDAFTSPVFRSAPFEHGAPSYRTPVGAPPSNVEVSPRTRFEEARRPSIQAQSFHPGNVSPRATRNLQYSPHTRESPSDNTASTYGPRLYRPFDSALPGAGFGPEYGPPSHRQSATYAATPRDAYEPRYEPTYSRRDSIHAPRESTIAHYDIRHEHRPVNQPDTRTQYIRPVGDGAYDLGPYARRVDISMDESNPEIAYSMYQSKQPSYFMPSQYDYRQGRARKRSNLPKQSTEIMKTWFDQVRVALYALLIPLLISLQNISNPYPSEEQKAVFSSVSADPFIASLPGIVTRMAADRITGDWHQHDTSQQLVHQPSTTMSGT